MKTRKLLLTVIPIFLVVVIGFNLIKFDRTSIVVQDEQMPQSSSIKALVLPHHDLLLEFYPDFYNIISSEQAKTIKRVVVLSPNHYRTDDQFVVTTQNSISYFNTDFVVVNDMLIESEHGVDLHRPFINQKFDHPEIIPLLFSRYVNQDELDRLIEELMPLLSSDDTILLASVDFSHFLARDVALQKDQVTLDLIREAKADEILDLNDDYLDCPACLYLVIKTMQRLDRNQPNLRWHANSAEHTSLSEMAPTTSYLVLTW